MSRRHKPLPDTEYAADITDLSHEGNGVGRTPDGKVVFIHGALPGERVHYKLSRLRKDFAEGELTRVETASPDRVTPPCPHFGLCGGCSLQHLAPAAQVQFKQKQLLDALERIGKAKPKTVVAPLTGPVWGYRRRARLSVRHVPKKGGTLVGFRERESPYVATMDSCEILDARVGPKLGLLARLLETLSLKQAVPQIEVATVDRVILLLRVMSDPAADDLEKLRAFGLDHGFEFWLQTGGHDSARPIDDVPPLEYQLDGDLRLRFMPTDFVQINAAVNQAMIHQALAWLAPKAGDRVLELFCGLGNFSLPLAKTGAAVTAVEGEAGLVQRARENAQRNGLDIAFHRGDLFKPDPHEPWMRADYDLALIDPPRLGAAEILPSLAAKKPQRIVYVSCHAGSLARDAGTLVNEYGYRLARIGVMDMFPHTTHIECMALFERPHGH